MLLTIYNLPYKGNEKRDISSLDRHSVATLVSPQTPISTEEIGDIQGANENPPRRAEIKVRKNEMKVPKNFVLTGDSKIPTEETPDIMPLLLRMRKELGAKSSWTQISSNTSYKSPSLNKSLTVSSSRIHYPAKTKRDSSTAPM